MNMPHEFHVSLNTEIVYLAPDEAILIVLQIVLDMSRVTLQLGGPLVAEKGTNDPAVVFQPKK